MIVVRQTWVREKKSPGDSARFFAKPSPGRPRFCSRRRCRRLDEYEKLESKRKLLRCRRSSVARCDGLKIQVFHADEWRAVFEICQERAEIRVVGGPRNRIVGRFVGNSWRNAVLDDLRRAEIS